MDEAEEYGLLSQVAYDSYYMGHDEAEANMQVFFPKYTIDRDLSDDHATTVSTPNGGVISYRGTDVNNFHDLMPDGLVALGYNREKNSNIPKTRFARANELYIRAKEKYERLTLTGHSLGGTLADYVSRRNNEDMVRAYVFNPGESPFEYFRFGREIPSHTTVYTTGNDAISYSGRAYQKHQSINFRPKTEGGGYYLLDAHSLKNFLPKKQIHDKKNLEFQPSSLYSKMCLEYPEKCKSRGV